jgi:hypothetical protein
VIAAEVDRDPRGVVDGRRPAPAAHVVEHQSAATRETGEIALQEEPCRHDDRGPPGAEHVIMQAGAVLGHDEPFASDPRSRGRILRGRAPRRPQRTENEAEHPSARPAADHAAPRLFLSREPDPPSLAASAPNRVGSPNSRRRRRSSSRSGTSRGSITSSAASLPTG